MHYLALLAITILAVISPGADFAMVARASSLRGHRAGLSAAFGIGFSCWLHVAYAIFLLAAIEHAMPSFMLYVRLIGAAWLAHAGFRMWLKPAAAGPADGLSQDVSRWRDFMSGFLTNALNPKTIVFVVSMFAQVVGPDASAEYLLLCGATISLCHVGWFAVVAYGLSRAAVQRRVQAHAILFNRCIGSALLGIGMSLIVV